MGSPTYVILLALFNDITMIPVAEDRQTASAKPQHARVSNLIGFSVLLGLMQSLVSMGFFLGMHEWHWLRNLTDGGSLEVYKQAPTPRHVQNAIWLQVSIAAELLIFTARAHGPFFLNRPSVKLFASTMLGNVIRPSWPCTPSPTDCSGMKWASFGSLT